jgi:hypothetical protein
MRECWRLRHPHREGAHSVHGARSGSATMTSCLTVRYSARRNCSTFHNSVSIGGPLCGWTPRPDARSTSRGPPKAAPPDTLPPHELIIDKNSLWNGSNIQKEAIVRQGNFSTSTRTGACLGGFSAGIRWIFGLEVERG